MFSSFLNKIRCYVYLNSMFYPSFLTEILCILYFEWNSMFFYSFWVEVDVSFVLNSIIDIVLFIWTEIQCFIHIWMKTRFFIHCSMEFVDLFIFEWKSDFHPFLKEIRYCIHFCAKFDVFFIFVWTQMFNWLWIHISMFSLFWV